MAISDEARKEFIAKVRPLKDQIADLQKKEKDTSFALKKGTDGVEAKKIELCELNIYIATLQIGINSTSVEMLDTKNNDALNDARKTLYKAIINLEEIVSNTVDCSYSELDKYQERLENIPVDKRLHVIRKLGLGIELLVEAFGDNSKWKESFVEMRGRHAVVAKNFINMKQASKDYFDHDSKVYEVTVTYVRLIRSLLEKSAGEYRDRYELASRRIDDIRMGINLLIALRRVAMVLGDSEESEAIRKKALVWKNKMEADSKAGSAK